MSPSAGLRDLCLSAGKAEAGVRESSGSRWIGDIRKHPDVYYCDRVRAALLPEGYTALASLISDPESALWEGLLFGFCMFHNTSSKEK